MLKRAPRNGKPAIKKSSTRRRRKISKKMSAPGQFFRLLMQVKFTGF
jgi:hypothetical protein